ncbi:MAG: hypothetical protein WCO44_16190 [Bacteroidota bacterium]
MDLFNEKETNLIVLINTMQGKYPKNNDLLNIAAKLAKQNCYLLSFDFANNKTFNGSIDTIITKAISYYKDRFALPEFPIEWELTESGKFLLNYMLAVQTDLDTSKLTKPEIEERIYSSYDSIILTVNKVITAGCMNNADNLLPSPKLDRFKDGVGKVFSWCSKEMPTQGIFKLGYAKIRYDENNLDLWKGEVIMTEIELQDLITRLDGVGVPQTSTTLCDRICTLWQTLISRFIGQQMLLDNSYLDLTICQIINRMIGSGFGYYCDEPVKRFTLRDICQGQQNVIEPAYAYLKEIEIKKELLKQKYNNEYFHISGETGGSSIKYYWVPISLLP